MLIADLVIKETLWDFREETLKNLVFLEELGAAEM